MKSKIGYASKRTIIFTMKKLITLLFVSITFLLTAQDFTITNFNINLEIDEKGAFHVQEIIDVNFTKKKRGIYRDIETLYKINGGILDIDLRNINIEGHEYKIDKRKEKVSIRIGSPDKYLIGDQKYIISYTINKGIITYPEHLEFVYDLTGNNWQARIENVDFTITLPKSITLANSDFTITGGRDGESLNLGTIRQVDSRTLKGNSYIALDEKNGLSVAIKLPKQYLNVAQNNITFYEPPQPKEYKPWYLALPIAIFGFFISFWRKMRQTDYVSTEDDSIQVYPPEGLTSAHLGGFIDQTANTRDIVSLLPYWASEGFIEMKQIGDEVYFYKMKNLDPGFPEYEHIVFDRLFEENDYSKISDLKTKFYTTLSKARSLLTKEVKRQDYYNQEYMNLFKSWKGILFPVSMILLAVISLAAFNLIFLGIGFILVAIGGFMLPLFKLPLTEKGANLKAEMDSFKRFLKNPEADVLEKVVNEDPSYFDRMFPFAVALGLEERFLDKLEPYMPHPPIWYHTDHHNPTFSTFRSGFKPEVIESVFSSSPHSASGGSSGGSFSSGGGVGGGGGGSW